MKKRSGQKRGRPPMYETAEQMQDIIDDYFDRCKGRVWIDEDTGEPHMSKYGSPIIIDAEPPTITGLALALGFTSRQALLNYQGKADFVDTVTRAKTRVEHYTETRLFDKDGCNGAKFSLTNNFKGWKETQEIEHSGGIEIKEDTLSAMLAAAGYVKQDKNT